MSVTFVYCVETAEDTAMVDRNRTEAFKLYHFEWPWALSYTSRFRRHIQSRGLFATAKLLLRCSMNLGLAFLVVWRISDNLTLRQNWHCLQWINVWDRRFVLGIFPTFSGTVLAAKFLTCLALSSEKELTSFFVVLLTDEGKMVLSVRCVDIAAGQMQLIACDINYRIVECV